MTHGGARLMMLAPDVYIMFIMLTTDAKAILRGGEQ